MAPKGRRRVILPTIEDSHEAPPVETEEEFWRVTAKRLAALQRSFQEILNGNPVPPELEWAVPDPYERMSKRQWEWRLNRLRALLRPSGPGGPGGPSATSAAVAPETAPESP